MQTLIVDLDDRSYPIYIGVDILRQADLLTRHIVGQQVMIVSNPTVAEHYLALLQQQLGDYQCDVTLVPDGEQHKTLQQFEAIVDELLQQGHHRSTTVIALGGGVVGDMAGFAAACYQRGVAFIQVPTTLLAQVDASVGGKTAVNHRLGKNMIGAFHQPQAVLIDIATLSTLPDREFNAGLAEIIKIALVCDAEFYRWLQQNIADLLQRDADKLEHAIALACALKAKIVAADETEANVRALLNLGHTFGHAIEQGLGYGEWLHGEAVAVGLVIAMDLSAKLGWIDTEEVLQLKKFLKTIPLPVEVPVKLTYNRLLELMAMDKKVISSKLRYILLAAIGNAKIVSDVDPAKLREAVLNNSSTCDGEQNDNSTTSGGGDES